jgi:hypothetical protein
VYEQADFVLSVTAADFDLDGDVDIASASYFDGSIRWYENLGDSIRWRAHEIYHNPIGQGHYVFAADMDGDGDSDLVATTMAENAISVFVAVTACDSSLLTPRPECCAAGTAWDGATCAPCPTGTRPSASTAGVCERCDAACVFSGYPKQPHTCSAMSRCVASIELAVAKCDCGADQYLNEQSQCAQCRHGKIKPRTDTRDVSSLASSDPWGGFSEEGCCVASTAEHVISESCTANSVRTILYQWSNPNCTGNASLPAPSELACEYVPTGSPSVSVVFPVCATLTGLVLVLTLAVVKLRAEPIIYRSQWTLQVRRRLSPPGVGLG